MATTKNINWNSNTQYAFGLYKLITKCLGTWPFDCQSILSKIQTLIVVILEITMATSILLESNLNCGVLHDISQIIMSSSINDWTTMLDPKAFEIMRKNAKLARFVCLFQMISGYLTDAIFITGPLIFLTIYDMPIDANMTSNSSVPKFQPLPLGTGCLFNEMSTHTYAAIYILQSIQILSTCTGNVGCDCYIFGIALHVAGQLDWLGEQFRTLNIKSTEQEYTKTLGPLVRRHNQLIQFANDLEDSFNLCIILILAVNMVQICLSGLQMIVDLRNGDIASVINGAIIFYVFNLQIFLYSYAGDRLSSGIANLHTAIYCSTWYNLPQRNIKDLVFIMLRTHKTFNLTGGKIYAMNIDSFKNILKATLSYFSVMQAMLEE
ncbi:odorant receptor 13a-like isoform X2 [Cotesia glomerata]|uniref:odorant receptor 13a-like isoform X2 n=1 Tax=Cotesia glomerata TaxID=32391 RepID=UPI001D01681D|nr:odorant receptor 13a-like isoform X2 [Cotesia glomerata]